MSLDLDNLSANMEKLLNDIIIKEKIKSLEFLKDDLLDKKQIIDSFINKFTKINKGKFTQNILTELLQIKESFNQLYENFDDKLMIFIIGNGNVGKSTLLNSLIGYKVAETNFLPNTWKIDVYSPELSQNKATIKYISGEKRLLSVDEVKKIINIEEQKSKESKKVYTQNLNKELKELKLKEQREEMKKYLGEKYLYKSNIAEVKWPVNKNWLLEKCLLVDTPGLNQNLYDLKQLGNIHDYYHKADGVLWLLDGQTIAAANTKLLFEELNNVLHTVGGVRNNIIGVINRMDLVRKNGGEDAVNKVKNDAKRIFGEKFYSIVDISAQQAFDGINSNNSELLKESGLLNLQNSIRDIFIAKSESIKNNSKVQGHNKLVNLTVNKLNDYLAKINEYEEIYIDKNNKLETLRDNFKKSLNKDVDNFFSSYLRDVERRVEIHVNALSEGNGQDFIRDKMYNLDEFMNSRDRFLNNKQLEIKNNYHNWEKISRIIEYKYIKDMDMFTKKNIIINTNLNLTSLNNISYFTPSVGEDIFSMLGNLLGKGMFFLRKGSIKNKINNAIEVECNKMREEIKKQLNDTVDEIYDYCVKIINITFSNILFNFKDIKYVKKELKAVEIKLKEERENIRLKEIIL